VFIANNTYVFACCFKTTVHIRQPRMPIGRALRHIGLLVAAMGDLGYYTINLDKNLIVTLVFNFAQPAPPCRSYRQLRQRTVTWWRSCLSARKVGPP
jgi:hypothetical protein